MTDETGEIKTQYTYDPYGNVTVTGEPSDNPFQYTGRENDGTGLYYYRFRYYSPELQRFISEDPLSLTQVIILRQISTTSDIANLIYRFAIMNPLVLNKYPYTLNNPFLYTDPFGLFNWGKVNWGKVGTGGLMFLQGVGMTYLGGYIIALVAVEAAATIESAATIAGPILGIAIIAHTVGLGGTFIVAGVAEAVYGFELAYEGFEEGKETKAAPMCRRK